MRNNRGNLVHSLYSFSDSLYNCSIANWLRRELAALRPVMLLSGHEDLRSRSMQDLCKDCTAC